MRVPIPLANGKRIVCPECGTVATVRPAQMRFAADVGPTPAALAAQWWEVVCPRSGRKLYPSSGPEMPLVQVIEPTTQEASHVG
jgi:hypothetical protein